MKKLYAILSAVLAFSFVVAILVLALTPVPVEARGGYFDWYYETDQGFSDTFTNTRKWAKDACGAPVYDFSGAYLGDIDYITKVGTERNICH